MLYEILIAPIEGVMQVVLSEIYEATASYGVSIFLLSLLINVVLLPLFQIAERWQEAERKIQKLLKPKLQEFRQAFSGEERHAMIQTLYRQVGYHPIYAMRSSFGLFLQMPFWIAAYHLLSHYQPLNGASLLVFADLGKPDRLLWGWNLLPFVMTGLNMAAAFVYTKSLSRAEQIQSLVLATLFLVLLYGAPAGLLLYWTFNSLFSLLRIALLDRTPIQDLAPGEPTIATSQSMPASHFVVNTRGNEKLNSSNTSGLGPKAEASRRKSIPFLDLPLMLRLVLFLMVMAFQVSVHFDRFILVKRHTTNLMAIGASIVLLAYLSFAWSWMTYRGGRPLSLRLGHIVVVWVLFAAFGLVNVAWLMDSYPGMHQARLLGAILSLLFFTLFTSLLANIIAMVRSMPNSNSLFAVGMSFTAFSLFVANPIELYVSSSDFISGIRGVVPPLLIYFVTTVFALGVLYRVVDKATKNALAVLSVFAAVSVIGYSAIGVKYAGRLSQFILSMPAALNRTEYETLAEIALLFILLGATSYVTIRHRQKVYYVLGAMLIASACATVVNVYRGSGAAETAATQLPIDHTDIIGFSREGNVLIIMLDGFTGGYFQKVTDEAPDVLKEYEGFTWYPNTLAAGSDTYSAIAALAGGHRYLAHEIDSRNYESVGSAINEAYSVYASTFAPKGYQVTYVNPAYARGCDKLDKRIRCIHTMPYGTYYRNKEEPDAPLLQGDSHIPLMLTMISLLKASPFFLKSSIYDGGDYLGANSTSARSAAANSFKAPAWGFLRILVRDRNVNATSKTFKFLQLVIPHEPTALNHDCKMQPEQSSVFTESVCALKEIGVLLAWMKETGIYDVTKIVVVSDHGWYVDNPMFARDFENSVPKGDGWIPIPGIGQPLLLVKDFDAKGDLHRSNTFLSNSDVPSIVCAAAEGCNGVGPDPILNNVGERTLTFTITLYPPDEEEKQARFRILERYEVNDNIFDPENWNRMQ